MSTPTAHRVVERLRQSRAVADREDHGRLKPERRRRPDPSTPSPSRRRPASSLPSSARATLRPPPRSSTPRVLRSPRDPPVSRPPPHHPHLAEDLHKVPSSARATHRPRPAALLFERFNRLVPEAEERSSLPRASPAPAALQPPRARSRGEELPLPRASPAPANQQGAPSLAPTAWTPAASCGPGDGNANG
ncbi:hypothetical protein VPH35_007802 [Triticum aestivum]|uniref:serine/arginine repetitive matrix protein 1 n=1 Tax=Triticum aestivum TaxID=4565 RepID=UPI001D023DA3|nr:serine/arginine repetitive matrix protein 1-like [Triticum aestivum]